MRVEREVLEAHSRQQEALEASVLAEPRRPEDLLQRALGRHPHHCCRKTIYVQKYPAQVVKLVLPVVKSAQAVKTQLFWASDLESYISGQAGFHLVSEASVPVPFGHFAVLQEPLATCDLELEALTAVPCRQRFLRVCLCARASVYGTFGPRSVISWLAWDRAPARRNRHPKKNH
jgi:hypothetical protein